MIWSWKQKVSVCSPLVPVHKHKANLTPDMTLTASPLQPDRVHPAEGCGAVWNVRGQSLVILLFTLTVMNPLTWIPLIQHPRWTWVRPQCVCVCVMISQANKMIEEKEGRGRGQMCRLLMRVLGGLISHQGLKVCRGVGVLWLTWILKQSVSRMRAGSPLLWKNDETDGMFFHGGLCSPKINNRARLCQILIYFTDFTQEMAI